MMMGMKEVEFGSDAVIKLYGMMHISEAQDLLIKIPNIKITKDIWFDDDVWDFSEYNKNNVGAHFFKYDFKNINPKYSIYAKLVISHRLNLEQIHAKTVYSTLNVIKRFCKFLELNEISYCQQINIDIVENFLGEIKSELESTLREHRDNIQRFLRTIESLHQDVDYSHIHDMLQKEKEKNKSKLFAEMKAQKTNMIPLKVFKNIVSLAVRDIKDETLGWKSKICACLVVILSETGMRVEELALLERGKLREIKLGDEREVTYLEFKVFKNQTNSAEGFKNTISFASDVCAFAYRELEKISESAIDELPSHQYHQLILGLKGIWIRQNKKGWKRMIKKRREAFNLLDEIEIETLDREAKKYLFINLEKGKATFNDPSGSFRRNLYKFFFRHRDDLKLQELGKNSLCKIKTKMLSAENETDKFIMNIESEKNSPNKYKKYDGSILYYVSPHQFRVTVCTKLMLEGVQLDFIRSHMNHLTEDITMGYSRCDEFTDPLEEGREILQEMADREGLLNTNPEEATDDFIKSDLSKAKTDYEAINKFLKKNKLNIVKDIDDLIKMVKRTNSPLLETEIGFCAWNAIHAICERRQYFSSVKDFYHIGVKIPSLKTLSISYKRFLEKQTIVKHNKTIADKDSKYKLEYDRERKALQKYIEKTLLPELKIAKEKIDELGIVSFLELYPDLKFIACRIDEILAKEVNVWTA